MDIVIMIDMCPKSGKNGFRHQIRAANNLVDAWDVEGLGPKNKTEFSVISYCGPRTWSGVSKCDGKGNKKVDLEKVCKVKVEQHFTDDLKATKSVISGLSYAPGTKLVSMGLLTAQSELTLGRKKAQSAVVAFIHGPPLSFRKTRLAAHALRKKTRLLWVVVAKLTPLKNIKKWASRRWQENVVVLKRARDWAMYDTQVHIVADICPKTERELSDGDLTLDGGLQ